MPTKAGTKKPKDSGIRAKTFAIVSGGLGETELNDFLAERDYRDILDKLQSSSGEIVHITIIYEEREDPKE